MTAFKNPLWIASATEDEARQIRAMEEEILKLEARRAELMFKKMVLTNRCCNRTISRRKV